MKEMHLSKRDRKKLIIQFAQSSKAQLIEIMTIIQRELSNRKHRKEATNYGEQRKGIISRIISFFKTTRRKLLSRKER